MYRGFGKLVKYRNLFMKSIKEGWWVYIVWSPVNYRQLCLTLNGACCTQTQHSLVLARLRFPGRPWVSIWRHQEPRNQPQPSTVCSKDCQWYGIRHWTLHYFNLFNPSYLALFLLISLFGRFKWPWYSIVFPVHICTQRYQLALQSFYPVDVKIFSSSITTAFSPTSDYSVGSPLYSLHYFGIHLAMRASALRTPCLKHPQQSAV